MKKAVCILLTVLALTSLCSCSRAEIKDDVRCADIGSRIRDVLADGIDYLEFGDTHKSFYFEDTDDYDDCYIVYSSDVNDINEFGIFHSPNADRAEDVYGDCIEYVEGLQKDSRDFIASYAPEELPKLDGAQVRRLGNYVIYTILPTDKSDAVFQEIENTLRK